MSIRVNTIFALLVTFLFESVSAEIVWGTTHGEADRRLAVATTNSHANASDPACIVGGYDVDHPTRVYVGGPCSKIKNGAPMSGFRWIVMETVWSELVDKAGQEAKVKTVGDKFTYQNDTTDYAEVGAGLSVTFADADIANAALFMSTTSYLSKSVFKFSKNSFMVDGKKKGYVKDVCVAPCAGAPKACTSCTADAISVTKGQYKYSILAAAFSKGTPKDWAAATAKYGTGTTKKLEGFLNVYQIIDFTNMNADKLIITDAQGAAKKYADMKECDTDTFKDAADSTKNCTTYGVKSATVESDGWMGSYIFPTTYNYGEWTKKTDTEYTAAHKGTETVPITCIRPALKNIKAVEPKSSKAVFLQYKFKVDGITGTMTGGSYMVYDPTVSTKSTTNQAGAGAGAGSTTAKAGSGTTAEASAAADAQVLSLFVALSLLGISW